MDYSFFTERLDAEITALESAYYHLLLVVGQHGAGKTCLVRSLQAKLDLPIINLNLQLSKKLLDLTGRQRILGIPKILDKLVVGNHEKAVVLDNTEVLFDDNLKLDPLRILQSISRNKTIVATWSGYVDKENLCYAEPGHPEYKRYPVQGVRIISIVENATHEGIAIK
jgi:hypothetical protein